MCMPNNSYRSGSDFERFIRDVYESQGYSCVRSAGSHTPVDLIAWKIGEGWISHVDLVQCKKERKKHSYDEDCIELAGVPAGKGWRKLLFVKRKGEIEVFRLVGGGKELEETFTVKELKDAMINRKV